MTQTQNNQKRFSNEQVKLLEINFRADSRLEAKSKQQLAGELGLQTRQVAVWFQNRRARSRTKQIERDYSNLKASYDNLASKVESLKRENEELNNQLQNMETLLGKHQLNLDSELGKTEDSETTKNQITCQLEDLERDKEKEAEILDLAPSISNSLTSSMDWCSFDSSCYVDESSGSQWWEFGLDQ